jgi:hypothetical protein
MNSHFTISDSPNSVVVERKYYSGDLDREKEKEYLS